MDMTQLRQRCATRLQTLTLPAPFDVRAFAAALQRERGRPIVLQPASCGPQCYGAWIAMPAADVIFYEHDTSPLHQEHIILHELCHILSGHPPARVAADDARRLLFPDLPHDLVRRLLQRIGYSTDEEREAEMLASLILERAGRVAPPRRPRDTSTAEVLARLETTLESPASGG